MNEADLYTFLEKRFVATFLDELLPGVFHNFANPLNGIMGRSKLMQRRMEDFIRKIENRFPEIEQVAGADYKKLLSDIQAINNESEKFFDMFRLATGKFYALGTRDVENLNLSTLIEAELGFADFYLEFKHYVKKEIHLDRNVPSVSGVTAYYSVAFWMLIREAAINALKQNEKAFKIVTAGDEGGVSVSISHLGDSMIRGWEETLRSLTDDSDPVSRGAEGEKGLICALMLIRLAGGADLTHDGNEDLLTIRIRHQR